MKKLNGRPAEVLRRLALCYLQRIKRENPFWTTDTLFDELSIPRSTFLKKLAYEAGFRDPSGLNPEQICAIASMCMRGIWCITTIASELSIDKVKVERFFENCQKGFGHTPYGATSYGGSKSFSDGKECVPRKVTSAGQLSYRGCQYTLGIPYRGRHAMVQERKDQLLVMFKDRAPLYLARRNLRSHC